MFLPKYPHCRSRCLSIAKPACAKVEDSAHQGKIAEVALPLQPMSLHCKVLSFAFIKRMHWQCVCNARINPSTSPLISIKTHNKNHLFGHLQKTQGISNLYTIILHSISPEKTYIMYRIRYMIERKVYCH